MRQQKYFEAYLDDFQKIIVFMSRNSYDGVSNKFYLRDQLGHIQELVIQSIEQTPSNYNKYTLHIQEELMIGNEYYVVHQHARDTILEYAGIVKTKRFDELFAYEGNDLGNVYMRDQSKFALWAPTAFRVQLEIEKHNVIHSYEMIRDEQGVFRYTILDNLENASYVYHVRVNGNWREATDPYAIASSANSHRSMIVDPAKIKVTSYPLPDMKSACDAILYECSVRDFTMQKEIGVENAGTFLAFSEENEVTKSKETGFSYLKSLGITHVQLMPVLDFGSVDENHPSLFYNWGYDPVHWRCLEGSLSVDANNPYERIFGFIKLIEQCHKHGIRVNLDVVFNHMYDMERCNFNQIVPSYYFQMNEQGDLSNGSFCGNDLDSKRFMCHKLIVDTCKFLTQMYQIDGLRFDLMGIIDIHTMNQVYTECANINPDFMVYGEGWDMPSFLPHEERAAIPNQAKMPHVAHFSDRFRDVSKGPTSQHEVNSKGYCTGAVYLVDVMKNVLIGSCSDYGSNMMFSNPINVVNYVECHDNMTCWDKLRECCKEETYQVRGKRQEMLMAACLLAQGIPFIHSGQEFARTKHGRHNTYEDSDEINKIDYERKDRFHILVDAFKNLVEIRKKYNCFRYATREEVIEHVDFFDIDRKVIGYKLHDDQHDMLVIFNPTQEHFTYELAHPYQLIYQDGKQMQDTIVCMQILPYTTMILHSAVSSNIDSNKI